MRASVFGSTERIGRVAGALVVGAAVSVFAGAARGQCEPGWEVGATDGLPDFDAEVTVTLNWDQDGEGPEPEMVVFGGKFLNAGNQGNVNHIVGWDGTRWVRFGAGLPNTVWGLGAFNGQLIASYRRPDYPWKDEVVRWDGVQWVEMSAGLESGTVGKFVVFEGSLYAAPLSGGQFYFSDGDWGSTARWDGTSWSDFDSSPAWNVFDMTVWNGRLVIAGWLGYFDTNGKYTNTGVLEWDPPWWLPIGTNAPKSAQTLVQFDGDLFVGGSGSGPNAVVGAVQRWDGQTWSVVGGGLGNETVTSFAVWDGKLAASMSMWDGAQWTAIPLMTDTIADRWCALGNQLIGLRKTFGSAPVMFRYAARLDGERWRMLGGGPMGWPENFFASGVNAVCTHQGRAFVGGWFQQVGGKPINAIAEWTADGWEPVGDKFVPFSAVSTLQSLGDDLFVSGESLVIESTMEWLGPVARWDGEHWHRLGTQYPWSAMPVVHQNKLFAYCYLDDEGWCLARWDDPEWTRVSVGEVPISALVSFEGDLVAFGDFTSIGGVAAKRVARWDGAAWHPMGAGLQRMTPAAIVHNGTLFAANGLFGWPFQMVRWDGAGWQPTHEGIPDVVTALAEWNGSLVAGTDKGVNRWNGAAWEQLAPVEFDPFAGITPIMSLAGHGDSLLVGGGFWTIGDKLSPHFARWREPVAPVIEAGPMDVATCRGGEAVFVVSASGSETREYRWLRDGVELEDGVTAWGSLVSGAGSAELRVSGVGAGDSGGYWCRVMNGCGVAESVAAVLAVCVSDFDCDGFVSGEDFDAFASSFEAGEGGADADGNGVVNGEDFDVFVGAFVAGC